MVRVAKDGLLPAISMNGCRADGLTGQAPRVPGGAYTALPDADLVALALDHNDRAFVALLARYDRDVRRLVARRIASASDIDDMVQAIWVKAWRALGSYDAARPFLNWISVIATNQCRDQHRRAMSYSAMIASTTDQAALGSRVVGTEEIVSARRSLSQVRRQMQSLPQQLRHALSASAEEQASHADIARHLNISAKAVEMRVRKARQYLRQALPHLA